MLWLGLGLGPQQRNDAHLVKVNGDAVMELKSPFES